MKIDELIKALRGLKVETGSLACPGCGHEHNCGIHGCAIMQAAADRLDNQSTHIAALQKEIENLRGQVPRWIPVMERRPEQDGKYLCVYSFRTMDDSPAGMSFPSVLDYYATDPVPHFQHEGVNEMHVTHWMPLPLPIPMEPIYG